MGMEGVCIKALLRRIFLKPSWPRQQSADIKSWIWNELRGESYDVKNVKGGK